MQEVEAVVLRDRDRFVPELMAQIEVHSEHTRRLVIRPVDEVVPSEEDITASLIERTDPPATPWPTPTQGGPTTVRADPLLELNDQIEQMESRIRERARLGLDAHTRSSLVRAQQALHSDLQQARDVLNRVEQARIALSHSREETVVGEVTQGIATPSPNRTGTGRSVQATVAGVGLVRVNGGLRVNLILVGPGGRPQVVQVMPGAARLLKGDRPGSVNDLRIGESVELALDSETGEVLQVRTLTKP